MLRPASLCLVLLSLAIAGCLGPTAPGSPSGSAAGAARLVCYDDNSTSLCNFEATLDPETRQANELSIAVNPLDPQNIIATGKDYTPEYAGECVWDGLYTTLDGGRTWKNQNVPGSPWKRLQDPSEPFTPVSNFWCATDPVVAFGPDGTAYWAVMPYQCDPLSGSKTGREIVPGSGVGIPGSPATGGGGGLNDWFWTCSSMFVLVSDDDGMTWPVERMRRVAIGPRLEHDKMWLTTAPNGNVLLCWDRSSDADAGLVPIPDQRIPHNAMVCSVSSDKGASWSEVTDMNNGWAGGLPWVDYGPDNVAWAAFIDGRSVLVSRSQDGLAWEDPVAVAPYANPPPNAEYGWPGLNGSRFRTFTLPVLTVDRTNGTFGGSVYVLWMDHSGDDADVLLSFSRDDGQTWSPPARVHDDEPALHADQFLPAMSVGPDGTLDLSWLDRRYDPAHHLIDLAYTYSVDGGATFAPSLRVTDASFDEQYSHHQNGAVFLGDYRDSDSFAGGAHVVWTDTRHQIADVFVATVLRPGTP
ncbi:MAG TPA: sialidase family protein [Candidatus Thermoplasmatota archaeon]|jgi:hypothetical protein|nr:sialidase family protein [Candidatus Thermoplasmatota archaeon]